MKIVKKFLIFFAASTFAVSMTHAQVITGNLDFIGFTNFSTVGGAANANIIDPNADIDTSSGFLSAILGRGASGNGYGAYGSSTAALNDDTFGSAYTFDNTGLASSAIKFVTDSGNHRLDLLVKNESTTNAFKLQGLHFDARIPNANANNIYTVQYLSNNGNSNLKNVYTNSGVENLADIDTATLSEGISEVDISIAAGLTGGGPVRLEAGDQASFRITWTGSAANFAQTQIDNVAFSGTFLAAVPEPSTYALLAGFAVFLFVAIKSRK